MFFIGGPQLGEVEAGVVAKLAGVRFSVWSGGALCILAALAAASLVPSLRKYEHRVWSRCMPDVVVVGAGVIGASVAWHLSRLGVRALLLEREAEPGKGSTGRATGGFRAQYGTGINVRLSLLSREKLRRFVDDTGVDPGYDPRGYLWLARTEAQLDILRGAQDVQLAAGLVEASMLDLRQIREVNPSIGMDGLGGPGCTPSDGISRPLADDCSLAAACR